MIGVVVWSSAEREKAVIWCEDHAALAYLQGRADFDLRLAWPEPGDLVELQTEMLGKLRHARQVRVLGEEACPNLPAMLRRAADTPDEALGSSEECHLRVVSKHDAEAKSDEARFPSVWPAPKLCVGS